MANPNLVFSDNIYSYYNQFYPLSQAHREMSQCIDLYDIECAHKWVTVMHLSILCYWISIIFKTEATPMSPPNWDDDFDFDDDAPKKKPVAEKKKPKDSDFFDEE